MKLNRPPPYSKALPKRVLALLFEKFPAFYGNRRFTTVFAKSRHLSVSWARLIQSTSYSFHVSFSVIVPSTPGSSGGLLPSDFPTKILCIFPLSPVSATCTAHFIILSLIAPHSVSSTNQHFLVSFTASPVMPNCLPHRHIIERPPLLFVP